LMPVMCRRAHERACPKALNKSSSIGEYLTYSVVYNII
jgi:hypothetical protein